MLKSNKNEQNNKIAHLENSSEISSPQFKYLPFKIFINFLEEKNAKNDFNGFLDENTYIKTKPKNAKKLEGDSLNIKTSSKLLEDTLK